MEIRFIVFLALTFLGVDASLPYSLPEFYEDIHIPRDLTSTSTNYPGTSTIPSESPTTAPVLVTPITSSPNTYESLSRVPFHAATLNSSSITASLERSSIIDQSASPGNVSTATKTLNNLDSTVEHGTTYIQTSSDSTLISSTKPQASSPGISASSKSSDNSDIPKSPLVSASVSPTANKSEFPSVPSAHKPDSPTNSLITVTATISASNGVASTVTIVTTPQTDLSGHKTMSSPQTSQTPTASAVIPAGSSLEVTLGSVAYQLPSSDESPIEVMLTDGSTAQLFSNRIIVEGQTVTIPSGIRSVTELSNGITAKPAEVNNPKRPDDNDENHDGGGLFGALGGIARGATSALGGAINEIGTVSTTAMAFAGGAAGASTGFAASLTGAIGDTSNLVASLNGIQKSFGGSQITKSALDTLTGAHSLSRQSLNWMKSTESLIKDFSKLPADVQSKLRDKAGEFANKGGQLDQFKQALELFQDFPWKEAELPNPSPTITPTRTTQSTSTNSITSEKGSLASQSTTNAKSSTKLQSTIRSESTATSSQISSSSSCTPIPTAEVLHSYFISSKDNTEWADFEKLTKNITVEGTVTRFDIIGSYMCIAKMNTTQAEEIKKSYEFIDTVGLQEGGPELDDLDGIVEHYRAIRTAKEDERVLQEVFEARSVRKVYEKVPENLPTLSKRTIGSPNQDAPWWKKMLSVPPPGPNETPLIPSQYPGYLADDTGGSGTTIYVVDDGFDVSLPDLASDGRIVSTHVVPNKFTLPVEVRHRAVAEDIRSPPGVRHGTGMAILAGGTRTGVAPKADLHLIKVKGHYYHSSSSETSPSFHRESSIKYWTEYIKTHIEQRRRSRQNGGPEIRSVINMSSGVKSSTYGPTVTESIKKIFQEFLDYCQENQIPVVVAAGNVPRVADVNENIPHIQSSPQDSMIIVGGVNQEGRPFEHMPADRDGLVHVWSPAEDIETPISATESKLESGTSAATAIVVLYYYGLPNLNHHFGDVNGGFQGAKGILVAHAWSRSPASPSVNVVYNLARGDPLHDTFPCVRRRGMLANPQNSGFCSILSISATSASSSASATSFSTAFSSSSVLSSASLVNSKAPTFSSSLSLSFSSTTVRDPNPTSSPRPSASSSKSPELTSKHEEPKPSTKTSQAPTKPTKPQHPQEPQRTGGYLSPPAPTPTERKHSCLNMIGLNSVYCNGPPAEAAAQ